ncbi:pectate lyase [Paramyrothecium foliicola]|nr:pectate lyase [Paramyrothecium foliicola]
MQTMAIKLLTLLAISALGAAQNVAIPTRNGNVISLRAPQTISGSKDFANQEYDRGLLCATTVEVGNPEVFILEDGASISNVIIGGNIKDEAIVCKGSCTLTNVWFRNLCENAVVPRGKGDVLIQGGGVQKGNNVVQHSGFGTVTIKDYAVSGIQSLYKSCSNCRNNGSGSRKVVVNGLKANNVGSVLVGINSNYGDFATIDKACGVSRKPCQEYRGNTGNGEALRLSSDANCLGTQGKLAALPTC